MARLGRSFPIRPVIAQRIPASAPAGTPIENLVENFSTKNLSLWNYFGTADAVGGRLSMVPNGTYGDGIDSQAAGTWDLRGSRFTIQVVQPLNVGNGSTEAFFSARLNATNDVSFFISGTSLGMRETVAGSASTTTVTFNATNHQWLRIDHTNTGSIVWQGSPDGVVWTDLRTKSPGATWTGMFFEVISGFYGTEPAPGTLLLDNLNVRPATVRSSAVAVASAAAVKAVAAAGRCVGTAVATAVARKVAPAAGTSVGALTARAASVHVATATARTSAVAIAYSAAVHVATSSARAVAVATAASAATKKVPATAVAVAVAIATASGSIRSGAGRCSAVATATAVASRKTPATATSTATAVARATAVHRTPATASAAAVAIARVATTKRVAATGRTVAVATASGLGGLTGNVRPATARCVGIAFARARSHQRTPRPNAGNTTRPNGGHTVRPFAGITYWP